MISGSRGAGKDARLNESKEVSVGYCHIVANGLEEAIGTAKQNPEFEYGTTAGIELRPTKMKEEGTDCAYPQRCELIDKRTVRFRAVMCALRFVPAGRSRVCNCHSSCDGSKSTKKCPLNRPCSSLEIPLMVASLAPSGNALPGE